MKTVFRALTLLLLLAPSVALAHSGPAVHTHGFVQGFLHPLGGLDHVLAMVAVGLLAAHLGGRALVLVPASFVSLMALGGTLGFAGIVLPYTELAIALSVIVLGALVAFRANLSLALASTIAGGFAIFHGYAHGAELPAGASSLSYAVGFLLATALLHLAGIALGLGFAKLSASHLGERIVQASGCAMTLAGVVLLARAF
ncbi:MAG: HupE/UreJ family protein [Xanthobacteraceae bacterium]|nr:HupE/UreJ family protein [Xanthobacteraceae bacterium]